MYLLRFEIHLLFWLTLIYCYFLLHTTEGAEDDIRITGGQNAAPHEFPFMVALHAKITEYEDQPWQHVCGGALVTKRHVITAGHCFNSTYGYSVVLGAHEKTGRAEVQRIKVRKWHSYPGYDENSTIKKNDIAVLILGSSAQLNNDVGVISLPKTDVNRTGEICTAIGWGRTSEGGPSSEVLMKAKLEIFPRETCAPRFRPGSFQNGTTCAYGAPEGTCAGDSGGPLICEDPTAVGTDSETFLFGVVSGGHVPCGGNTSLELYTRVGYSDHLNFITNLTSQEVTGGEDEDSKGGSCRFQISDVTTGIISFMIFKAGIGHVV